MGIGHEAPVAAVEAIVAVVTHDHVMVRRHLTYQTLLRLDIVAARTRTIEAALKRNIGRRTFILGNRETLAIDGFGKTHGGDKTACLEVAMAAFGYLFDRLTVQRDFLVLVDQCVTRQGHDALDVILIGFVRGLEHGYIASIGPADRDDLAIEHRQAYAVAKFIDQDEIADHEPWAHRTRRNSERLGQERAQQEHEQ
jgi:hypothetical protein